jgi:hypothetical protein
VPFPTAIPSHNLGCRAFLAEFLLWINKMVTLEIRENVSVSEQFSR